MAITKYLNLITSKHRQQPNFIAWLSAALNKVDDGITATNSIPSAFDVSSATGTQLDLIGTLVGANRNVGVQLSTGSGILDDSHYQTYIQAKIAANQWDGTTPGLLKLWSTIFPNSALKITDNQDMTISINISGITDAVTEEMINDGLIIPKPMGVQITSITFGTVLIFNVLDTYTWDKVSSYTWDQLELS